MAVEYLEQLSGTVDGVNKVFTSSHTVNSSPVIYINGIVYPEVDTVFGFTVFDMTWTLVTAPTPGDVVVGYYIS